MKLEFAYDLCTAMARAMNAETRPEVAVALGEIWAYAQLTRAATTAAEAGAHTAAANVGHRKQRAWRESAEGFAFT